MFVMTDAALSLLDMAALDLVSLLSIIRVFCGFWLLNYNYKRNYAAYKTLKHLFTSSYKINFKP